MKTAKVLLKDLSITELKSQYDLNARYLLAHKNILARIMAGCIRNYRGMTPEEIFPLIRDDIKVDIVRVEPGMTNSKIKGLQREDYHPGEGRIVFDIRFTARLPENETILIIINLEIENGHFPSQKLLSRSIYYPVRELSSQGDRDFSLAKQEYEKLSKVYSIWILMDVPEYMANTIRTIKLHDENLYGNDYTIPGNYDFMETILIGVGKKESDVKGIPDMLFTLLTNNLRAEEKRKILEEKYGMRLTEEETERANNMCNLSDAILEKGLTEGIEIGHGRGMSEGIAKGENNYRDSIIRKKLMKGQSIEFIADFLEEDIETVRKVAKQIEDEKTVN